MGDPYSCPTMPEDKASESVDLCIWQSIQSGVKNGSVRPLYPSTLQYVVRNF